MKFVNFTLAFMLLVAPLMAEKKITINSGLQIDLSNMEYADLISTVETYLQDNNLHSVSRLLNYILKNKKDSAYKDPNFYFISGKYNFIINQFKKADAFFSKVITLNGDNIELVNSSIDYKLAIVNALNNNKNERLAATYTQVSSNNNYRLDIWDELIALDVVNEELLLKILYDKAECFYKMDSCQESLNTIKTILLKYPRSYYAAEAYVLTAKNYIKMFDAAYDNNLLEQAQENLKDFKEHFPEDSRLELVKEYNNKLRNKFAVDMYKVANFYQKKGKKLSAYIYFDKLQNLYPEFEISKKGKKLIEKFEQIKA